MYTLIIDSSTKILYEALIKDQIVIDERYVSGQNDHAKNIVSTLEDMLTKANISTKDLSKVICGIGPGSYTGVRMGVTVAKMLGAFGPTKIYKISTLAMMASGTSGNVLSMIDARRGNSFCAAFSDYQVIEDDELRNSQEFINKYKGFTIVTEKEFKVDPIRCISIAELHENPHSLEPNYLQDTEAERNLHGNK